MDASKTMKAIFIFLMVLMTIAVNVEDNVLARLNLDQSYLLMALLAVVITGLIMHRNLMLVVLILLLSVGANMPSDFMLNFGLDRDYFVGALGAIILLPLVKRQFE